MLNGIPARRHGHKARRNNAPSRYGGTPPKDACIMTDTFVSLRGPGRQRLSWAVFLMALMVLSLPAYAAEGPKAGDSLASLSLPAPQAEADKAYLGLSGKTAFTCADLPGTTVILVIGVYCPLCHKQAPLMQVFFDRLKADPEISGKVRIVGLAAGATEGEMEYLREKGDYPFPVIADSDYAVHKRLGEPKTPFVMVVDKSGKVLSTHLGVIEDMDAFYQEIKKLSQ
jgi:hypothetical protein